MLSAPIAMGRSESWRGVARMTFARMGSCTRPRSVYTQAPFKVQRSFHDPTTEATAGICQTVLLHTAGGMVGGDGLACHLTLEPESQVLLTTTAAQKIYRSTGAWSQQEVYLHLEPGSSLEYFPLETILFEGALYQQKMAVDLQAGAYLATWDITRLGRSARGEQFTHGQWRSAVDITTPQPDGMMRPLWIDRQWLRDPQMLLHSPFGLGGDVVVGTLLLLGQAVTSAEKTALEQAWQAGNDREPSFTLSRAQEGIVARYRGNSTQEARQGFLRLWEMWKTTIVHQPFCRSRVWS